MKQTLCMTRFEGKFGALDNACPHQGGPLGEGSIENGQLRCPWHGWDFHPVSGDSPGGFDDGVMTHPVSVRDDGIYVGLEDVEAQAVETLVQPEAHDIFDRVAHPGIVEVQIRLMFEEAMPVVGARHHVFIEI